MVKTSRKRQNFSNRTVFHASIEIVLSVPLLMARTPEADQGSYPALEGGSNARRALSARARSGRGDRHEAIPSPNLLFALPHKGTGDARLMRDVAFAVHVPLVADHEFAVRRHDRSQPKALIALLFQIRSHIGRSVMRRIGIDQRAVELPHAFIARRFDDAEIGILLIWRCSRRIDRLRAFVFLPQPFLRTVVEHHHLWLHRTEQRRRTGVVKTDRKSVV